MAKLILLNYLNMRWDLKIVRDYIIFVKPLNIFFYNLSFEKGLFVPIKNFRGAWFFLWSKRDWNLVINFNVAKPKLFLNNRIVFD